MPIKKSLKKKYVLLILAILFFVYSNLEVLRQPTHFYNQHGLISPNLTLNVEFNEILQAYCDVKTKVYPLECLKKIRSFDIKNDLLSKRTHAEQCKLCFYYNSNNDATNSQKLTIYYHTFWQLNKVNASHDEFNMRVLKLNIMSYLSTQNLCCTRFILWTLKEFPDEFLADIETTFEYYIKENLLQLKQFDLDMICAENTSSFKSTKLCSSLFYRNENLSRKRLVALSDLVRFVVLELYGGIYTDGDVIMLKDMKDLWGFNFAYRWSIGSNLNTAVLGLNLNVDPSVRIVYDHALNSFSFGVSGFYYLFHPYKISNIVRELNGNSLFEFKTLRVLNCVLFDPAWICADSNHTVNHFEGVCDFSEFNRKSIRNETSFRAEDFFGGAFTYHLHLKNLGFHVNEMSFFKYFENFYLKNLKIKS